jgi:hypothetical protein
MSHRPAGGKFNLEAGITRSRPRAMTIEEDRWEQSVCPACRRHVPLAMLESGEALLDDVDDGCTFRRVHMTCVERVA